jgi:hypothetical protein
VVAGSTATASVWVQTMDSCKQALGGARYQVVGDGGLDLRVTTPAATKQAIGSASSCPWQQGDCASVSTGCVQIANLPPGGYRIHELRTPAGDNSNPEGYAACNGGSACQSQDVDLVVSSSGVASATVTNVYPDGTVAVYPTASDHGSASYDGTASDPIVVHNFGLAPPDFQGASQCDDDSDADDHSTGSPSAHCGYPEGGESSACMPFPWSCTLAPLPTTSSTTSSTSTTTTTTTTTSSTSSSTTTTSSSTATAACGHTDTTVGRLKKGTTKLQLTTAAAGPMHATLSWSPAATVRLLVVDRSRSTVAQATATGTALGLDARSLAAGRYSLQLKLSSARSVGYTLAVSHC